MKNILVAVGSILLFILMLPLAILYQLFRLIYAILHIICFPIEMCFYLQSDFHKKTGLGYHIGVTRRVSYGLYKYIKENSLAVELVATKKIEYIVYENELLVLHNHAVTPSFQKDVLYLHSKWQGKTDNLPIEAIIDRLRPLVKPEHSSLPLRLLQNRDIMDFLTGEEIIKLNAVYEIKEVYSFDELFGIKHSTAPKEPLY